MRYYKGNITNDGKTIFVFGSNPEGRHGAGAAKVARLQFGAIYGQGEGLQGMAYAIPTKDLRISYANDHPSISPEEITASIKKMYACARNNPTYRFCIAYRNIYTKSLNGYTGMEMMQMFINAGPMPENVQVSEEWYKAGIEQRAKSAWRAYDVSYGRDDLMVVAENIASEFGNDDVSEDLCAAMADAACEFLKKIRTKKV